VNEIDLTRIPHSEAKKLLQTGAPVYLLVNPIEYHGPHLPLKNDFLLSLGIARELHRELCKNFNQDWPFLQAAALQVGVGPAAGPGTVSVPYLTVRKLVIDACRGLEALGAKRVALVTFHGDPLHNLALDIAARDLHSRGVMALAPFSSLLNALLNYHVGQFDHCLETVQDPSTRKILSDRMATDFHGGFFETSLMLHYWPQLVDPCYQQLPVCPEYPPVALFKFLSAIGTRLGFKKLGQELDFVAMGLGWVKLKNNPGYTGQPHLANSVSGQAFAQEALRLFVDASTLAFREIGYSPTPILKWTAPLSLNGRVAV